LAGTLAHIQPATTESVITSRTEIATSADFRPDTCRHRACARPVRASSVSDSRRPDIGAGSHVRGTHSCALLRGARRHDARGESHPSPRAGRCLASRDAESVPLTSSRFVATTRPLSASNAPARERALALPQQTKLERVSGRATCACEVGPKRNRRLRRRSVIQNGLFTLSASTISTASAPAGRNIGRFPNRARGRATKFCPSKKLAAKREPAHPPPCYQIRMGCSPSLL